MSTPGCHTDVCRPMLRSIPVPVALVQTHAGCLQPGLLWPAAESTHRVVKAETHEGPDEVHWLQALYTVMLSPDTGRGSAMMQHPPATLPPRACWMLRMQLIQQLTLPAKTDRSRPTLRHHPFLASAAAASPAAARSVSAARLAALTHLIC